MLTLEFKAHLNEQQIEQVEKFLAISKTVWNCGLAALEEFDRSYRYYRKTVGTAGEEPAGYAPCCPVLWEYRPYWLTETGAIDPDQKGEIIWVPFSRIYSEQSHWYIRQLPRVRVPQPSEKKESWGWVNTEDEPLTGYSCPCSVDWKEPLIKRPGLTQAGGLGQVIKGDNIPEHLSFTKDSPYKFRSGELTHLDTSWQEHIKSRAGLQNGVSRGKPKFKRRRDKVTTLVHPNPKGVITPKGNNILGGIPGLGSLRIKGLDKRWRNPIEACESDPDNILPVPEIAVFKLCKKASGYYVQLTGKLVRQRRIKQNQKSIGVHPGIENYLSLSNGKQYGNPQFYQKAQAKLAELQRKLCYKMTSRLILWLNHPERKAKDLKQFIAISPKDAMALCSIKTEQEGIALIGGVRWQTLKWNCQPPSKEQLRLTQQIGRLHEKIKRQRSAFNHKISSELVSNYGGISFESGVQGQTLREKAKPVEAPKGGYQKNGRKVRSQLAKALADSGHGDVMAKCELKAKRDGRIHLRNPSPYSSQDCPVCLQRHPEWQFDPNPKKRTIKHLECECGWSEHRDIFAAINDELAILANALTKGKKKWADLSLEQINGELPFRLTQRAENARQLRCIFLELNEPASKAGRRRKNTIQTA